MVTLRTYRSPDQAHIDAGFLCSMGVDAVVCHEPAYGGNLMGVVETPMRIDVPDDQAESAQTLLDERSTDLHESDEWMTAQPEARAADFADPPINLESLESFYRAALWYNIVCWIFVPTLLSEFFTPEIPPEVEFFLQSLALSQELWVLSYSSFWLQAGMAILSSLLCLRYSALGRVLFALAIVWSIISQLGPPPMIFSPWWGFFGSIQGTLTCIALALMYWSPLREKFNGPPQAASTRATNDSRE